MDHAPLRVGIIGCGNIAERYGPELVSDPRIELLGVTDLVGDKAEALARALGCRAYTSPDELLADGDVESIINLTSHQSHFEVSARALDAGKHVYSEKPLALSVSEAQELVDRAAARQRRLACAPSTFMAEAQQTAWKVLREGAIGEVRVVYAEVNWGRIESWHPAPEAFYDAGVMPDVGVYPLSILTAIYGPAQKVWAYGKVVQPDRKTADGRPFQVRTPEFVVAIVELRNGPLVRLTANWYVASQGKQEGIEFHGDDGSLFLSSWLYADAHVELAAVRGTYEPLPLVKQPERSVTWSRAVVDMASAIAEGRPHRASGQHAAHLVEIVCAASESMARHAPVEIRSTFEPPAPMEWGE
jgi:predicted dehydrogenase